MVSARKDTNYFVPSKDFPIYFVILQHDGFI